MIRKTLAAAAFYAVAFFSLTWPAVTRFHTHFYADQGDGLQNIWNLWWIDRAITVLHANPWHTTLLHYPYGTSLLGHTLNPFNGLIAIPFLRALPLVVVHNGIVTFAFVAAGVTAFLLADEVTHAYWPSVLAGFVFTFSNYHFEHAEGHLQLVSLEWMPLFLLLWLRLLRRPRAPLGAAAAFVLFLVLLCDHYYFFYCAIAAAIMLAWALWHRSRNDDPSGWLPALGAFAIVSLATSGVLVGALLLSNARDPLVGAHPAYDFSLDALAPFIYGGHWRFGNLTRAYWQRLSTNYHESSVHLGFSVIALVAYTWFRRKSSDSHLVNLFFLLLAVFLVLALGPILQVGGKEILGHRSILPYAWMQTALPFLSVSGVPIRMMAMVTLAAAVLCAFGFELLWRGTRPQRIAAIALTALLVVEDLPKPIPTLQIPVPEYVRVLRELPGDDAVVDMVSGQSDMLAYQVTHQKPIAFGYLARLPQSVVAKDRELEEVIRAGRFDRLWPDYRLRYVVAAGTTAATLKSAGIPAIWSVTGIGIFDVSRIGRP